MDTERRKFFRRVVLTMGAVGLVAAGLWPRNPDTQAAPRPPYSPPPAGKDKFPVVIRPGVGKENVIGKDFQRSLEAVYGKNEGVITFEDFLKMLPASGRILIGEAHFEPTHMQTAEAIVAHLTRMNKAFVIGLERFSSNEQGALDRFIGDKTLSSKGALDQLLSQTDYLKYWYSEETDPGLVYIEFLIWAKENNIRLIGLDLPETRGGNQFFTSQAEMEEAEK